MITLEHILFLTFMLCSGFVYTWYQGDDYRLARRDPVAVDHEEEIGLLLGQKHKIKTLSVNPPIFEVKNFLSPEECNYLIFMAKRAGLHVSPIHTEIGNFKTTRQVFDEWDVNNDTYVEPVEFTYIRNKGNLYLTEVEMMGMMENLHIDKNDDNKMDFEEFQTITAETIGEHFQYLSNKFPRLRSRLSKQAWIWHQGAYDSLLEGFHERISKLARLPHELIEVSEPMQVVNYGEGGHYYCHQDSDEIDASLPCCTHHNMDSTCRQCRYLTIMFFLNNVTRGGQTVFPVADNKTFTTEGWEQEAPIKCNLADNCEASNLVIEPVQGTALLWYNHHIDDATGWLGDLDPMTYHGGCDVATNEKWIANTWLNVIGRKHSTESQRGWLSLSRATDEL